MENRVVALEKDFVRLKNDISELAKGQKEVYNQQVILDKTVNKVLIQLSDHFEQSSNFDKTIRNIDDSVNRMSLKIATGPMERHREIQEVVHPILQDLESHEKRFTECGDVIKSDIRRELRNYVLVIWFALVIISSLGIYIIEDAETHIQERQEMILEQLDEHSNSNRSQGR